MIGTKHKDGKKNQKHRENDENQSFASDTYQPKAEPSILKQKYASTWINNIHVLGREQTRPLQCYYLSFFWQLKIQGDKIQWFDHCVSKGYRKASTNTLNTPVYKQDICT